MVELKGLIDLEEGITDRVKAALNDLPETSLVERKAKFKDLKDLKDVYKESANLEEKRGYAVYGTLVEEKMVELKGLIDLEEGITDRVKAALNDLPETS